MTVYVHNRFLRQLQDRNTPPDVMKAVLRRFREISELENAAALSEYMAGV